MKDCKSSPVPPPIRCLICNTAYCASHSFLDHRSTPARWHTICGVRPLCRWCARFAPAGPALRGAIGARGLQAAVARSNGPAPVAWARQLLRRRRTFGGSSAASGVLQRRFARVREKVAGFHALFKRSEDKHGHAKDNQEVGTRPSRCASGQRCERGWHGGIAQDRGDRRCGVGWCQQGQAEGVGKT